MEGLFTGNQNMVVNTNMTSFHYWTLKHIKDIKLDIDFNFDFIKMQLIQ